MNKVYANVPSPKYQNNSEALCDSSVLQAALNVGGVVLNALAIEHFILRHQNETKYVSATCLVVYTSKLLSVHDDGSLNMLFPLKPVDEKEMLLRHAYGLGYPEPNVTFALCRGSWSSPAVSILLFLHIL